MPHESYDIDFPLAVGDGLGAHHVLDVYERDAVAEQVVALPPVPAEVVKRAHLEDSLQARVIVHASKHGAIVGTRLQRAAGMVLYRDGDAEICRAVEEPRQGLDQDLARVRIEQGDFGSESLPEARRVYGPFE